MTDANPSAPTCLFSVPVYGFDDVMVEAATPGKATYQAFKVFRDGGRFVGRDGFWRFLIVAGRPSILRGEYRGVRG